MTVPLSYPLALALITSPVTDCPHLSHLSPVVYDLAVAWELMDSHEDFQQMNFVYRVGYIQKNYRELADAPLSWESMRFPSYETAMYCRDMSEMYVGMIKHYWLETYPGDTGQLMDAADEVTRIYWVWETVRHISPVNTITHRREGLRKLRDLLGEQDFHAGILPEPIPPWRCKRVD